LVGRALWEGNGAGDGVGGGDGKKARRKARL
jgi:hypothetical protein